MSVHYADLRVLVADDNVINQRVMQAMLQLIGITPIIVSDGAAALAKVEQAPFDLILTDLDMPVLDGLAAIELIRALEGSEQRARTPLFVVSSRYDAPDVRASAKAGADGHLAKPVRLQALLSAVLKGLKHRKSQPVRPDPAPPDHLIALRSILRSDEIVNNRAAFTQSARVLLQGTLG